MNGGVPRRLTVSVAEDAVPSWSHDGRSIYFMSSRSGSRQIWRVAVDPQSQSPPTVVTENGGFYPSASQDGKYLYFAKERAPKSSVWRIALPTGDAEEIIQSLRSGYGNWQLAGDQLYFVDAKRGADAEAGEPGWTLRRLDLSSGQTVDIRELLSESDTSLPTLGGPGFSVSPDGVWILVGQGALTADLMLVENFR